MRKLRIALFIIFAALYPAWAQCNDFDVFANGIPLSFTSNSANYPHRIGDPLIFTTSESIDWQMSGIGISSGTSYEPPTSLNATGNVGTNITYTLKNSCNTIKTLNLQLQQRTYTVSFESNGGSAVASQTGIIHGGTATKPTNPTRTGYDFNYWYLNSEANEFIFSTLIEADNIKLTAKWTIKQYKVTFESTGDVTVPQQTINHGSTVTKPSDPTRVGYNFAQWESPVGTSYNFTTPVTGDITLTGKWNIRQYTVTFNSNGGSAVAPQTINHGSMATKPTDPTRTGYTITDWKRPNGNSHDFATTAVTSDITLTATWTPNNYTITFNVNCPATSGTCPATPSPKTVTYTGNVGTLTDITLIDYEFLGWFDASTGGTKYTSATTYSTAGNITLNAQWKIKTYTVNFTGENVSIQSQTIDYGKFATEPVTKPTRTGYDFEHWELGGSQYFFNTTPVIGNISLAAKWKPKIYTVSFEGLGTPQLVPYSSNASKPAAKPAKTGFDFVDWDFNFNTPITKDTLIAAKWEVQKFTITFNANAQGATVSPSSKQVTHNTAMGDLPVPIRAAHAFKGWFTETEGGVEITKDTIYTAMNNITLYARWEFVKGTVPTIAMLNYVTPSGLIYRASPIDPIIITQRDNVIGTLGEITTLYDGKSERPINAGIYSISAYISASEDYASATIPFGNIIINRREATLPVISVTAKNKTYDGTRSAEITEIYFNESELFAGDNVSAGDYSIIANFVEDNVGENINVNGVVSWLSNGPLSKNYALATVPLSSSANITQAIGYLVIKAPEKYELSNPVRPSVLEKNPFIKDDLITWEYRRIEETNYSKNLPNRVGEWIVKAWFNTTDNYTGAIDSAEFAVERGSATTVIHKITFEEGFTHEPSLSNKLLNYFAANSCDIKSVDIQITVIEPEIVFVFGIERPRGDPDEDGYMRYQISRTFDKPGQDTVIYNLLSTDGIYSEQDTILIEIPIPFDSVAMQKWNNVLFINNNPSTNGGYKFKEFKWFKNGSAVSDMQFYSAGPSSKDTLNPSDVYKVTMHTMNGMRISTCEGNSKTEVKVGLARPNYQKQVLGINGKTAKSGAKIYNLKGMPAKDIPAGIYIVGEDE